ncbi:hypothetical protein POM88_039259 [Heracleum sosnowskyi]|uniref:DNA topoisomerase I DNA binding eukaryotic-type domain-containing protein n=1 Tax=Heracleum sosnowskyi TaxID=360622 RepID=A0AAD8HBX9_9APIA|nr:hypothetical protein POM88_039259 [Heracleum sosnowskyi]
MCTYSFFPVATMFAVMLDTEYMTKPKFMENFMSDWKKILGNKHIIQNLEDFLFTLYRCSSFFIVSEDQIMPHLLKKKKKKVLGSEEGAFAGDGPFSLSSLTLSLTFLVLGSVLDYMLVFIVMSVLTREKSGGSEQYKVKKVL